MYQGRIKNTPCDGNVALQTMLGVQNRRMDHYGSSASNSNVLSEFRHRTGRKPSDRSPCGCQNLLSQSERRSSASAHTQHDSQKLSGRQRMCTEIDQTLARSVGPWQLSD